MKRLIEITSFIVLAASAIIMLTRCDEDREHGQDTPFLKITKELSSAFDSEGGKDTLVFSTNEAWSISLKEYLPETKAASTGKWYKVSPLSGDAGNDIKIQITLEPNEEYAGRGFSLIINGGTLQKHIEVKQLKKNAVIADKNLHEISSFEQLLAIKVKSNIAYGIDIKEGKDWISEAPKARSGELTEASHTFTISANPIEKERTGVIIFRDSESGVFDEVTVVQAAETQRAALVAFYNEMGGEGWTDKDNWCSNKPLNQWYGVETDYLGNVQALRLPHNNLSGIIGWGLSKLTKLQHLDLSWNTIEGFANSQEHEGNLSINCLDDLTAIETINLSHNKLTGSSPLHGRKLPHLESFNISFNQIYDSVFAGICSDMFENDRTVDLILNNNNMYDEPVPEYLKNHPEWNRIAFQCIRQIGGDIRFSKDIILPDFRFTDLHDASIRSMRDVYSNNKMTMVFAWDPTQKDSQTFIETTVRRVHTLFNGQGFEVVAITPEGDKFRKAAIQYLQENDVPFSVATNYVDAKGSPIILPSEPYPSYFLVDSTGKLLNDIFTGQSMPTSYQQVPGDPYYLDLMKFPFVHTDVLNKIINSVFGNSKYQSTDYSMDKKYEILQHATKGKGIDILLIGDAYTDVDIATGFYRQVMEYAMEMFFAIEPTKSYREYFNIYMSYAVSRDAYIAERNDGGKTALDIYIYNDVFTPNQTKQILENYYNITNINSKIPTIGVIINGGGSISLTKQQPYSLGFSYGLIAFKHGSRYGFRGPFIHNNVGHAFGLFADEYYGNGEISENVKEYFIEDQKEGLYLNVSPTNDPKSVNWSHLIGHYKYPYVSIYQGGYNYDKGIWRSELYSVMQNTDNFYFNAICRELIVKRILELAGEEFSFEKFVQKDIYEPEPPL